MREEISVHKGKWITGSARKELAEAFTKEYREGRSIRAIAEAHGRSYGFVHRVLTETGVPLRARGGDARTGAAPSTR
ncbi:transcriptional regulator [Streptomyces regensis]|uniref:Helix-turn-helix domain-containing protein n=1 Tax=Streptomyces flaveolus TaxID=67297 RepID=A0ABV3AF25_9ACTN|nr:MULTISPECIES: helix-turn-helix domain-containing protein [Streptomyces]KMS92079.1 transcriptional regulator [Streptomyces regensis]KOG75960.1 transcriptional regulator [Streptomyces antibioticus]KOX01804.1 transcriptional regulator [Streptomyces sp. NRRL WC-3723]